MPGSVTKREKAAAAPAAAEEKSPETGGEG
jgi:hypothetical protein